jgi:hypothetical protein
MDDRDLEARLRTRLHSRFDGGQVPAELATSVRQALATTPSKVGFGLRMGGLRLGWPAVAAAVFTAFVIVVGNLADPSGPGNRPSPSPFASAAAAERHFIVLAPAGLPSKPESSLASDVLDARMRALGIGTFTSAIGYAIQFIVPADGPSDDAIRAVLAPTGDVQFVPLPPEDYGDGKLTAEIGQALPKDEPPLFGWEGIESVAIDATQQSPALTMTLKPAAKAAFADYTAGHHGETFAILIDDRVAMLPIINEPIPGGQVNFTGGGADIPGRPDEAFAVIAAILVGGMLPEAWRGADVPAIVSEEFAIDAVKGLLPYATVATSDLDAEPDGDGWRPVWLVVVTGVVSAVIPCPTEGPGNTCFVPGPTRRVVIDAERGNVIRIEMPPE